MVSQPHHADLCAAIAHVLDRVTRCHRMAALQEKDDVGSFGHELFDPRIVPPPENARELVVNLLDDRHRAFHGARTLQLERRTLLRHDLRSVRHRMPRIERIRMLVGRQEFLHLSRIGQLDIGGDVRNEETVLADHLGQEHARVLTDSIGHQVIVERLLRVARPAHEPAHIARRQRVGMLGTEIAGGIERPVGNHHLHRHAAARNRRIQLVGKLHADARAARENTRAARRSAVRDAQLRVLAVGHDVLGVELPVGDHLRERHHRRRVRPDRVGRNHIDVGDTWRPAPMRRSRSSEPSSSFLSR